MGFKNVLQKILANHEGVLLKIDTLKESSCTQPGQNFMSVVSLAQVQGKLPDGKPYSKSVFVKRPTPRADHNLQFSMDDAFNNEVLMYRTVLPLITEAADVTRASWPLYYHASDDVIVLEDLRDQGFCPGDAAHGFDLVTARCIVKELAKFHAATFHTRLVQKERFDGAVKRLKPLGLVVSGNRAVMEVCLTRAIRYIEAEDDVRAAATSLRRLQGKVTERMRELREPSNVAVLVHGDFWFNNILARGSHGGSADQEDNVRMIDFQACALKSPAVDFWLFLYTSVSSSILADNCDSFVHLYCSTFLKTLDSQKYRVEQLPNIECIKYELESKELYGFLAAMAYLPALYFKRESIEGIGKASEEELKDDKFLEKFVGPEFRERLLEVARYAFMKGVL